MKILSLLLATALAGLTPGFSAGFTNLNFERAVVQLNDPNFGWLDWPLAAPGWNHSTGVATEAVHYGLPHLGTAQIYMLMDTNTYSGFTPYEGNYSLMFASGYATTFPEPVDWTQAFISQTGDIPNDTCSLQLIATGPFEVFLNETLIPMLSLGGNRYGANIPGFAGTTAQLTIMNTTPYWAAWSPEWFGRETSTIVDDIVFSPVAIPEPSSLALLGLGLSGLLRKRRHRLGSRRNEVP